MGDPFDPYSYNPNDPFSPSPRAIIYQIVRELMGSTFEDEDPYSAPPEGWGGKQSPFFHSGVGRIFAPVDGMDQPDYGRIVEAGSRLREQYLDDTAGGGTATSASANSLTDTVNLTQPDNYWNGYKVRISSGTGMGQERLVTDYTQSTHTLLVAPNWDITPDSSSTYLLYLGRVRIRNEGQTYRLRNEDDTDFADLGAKRGTFSDYLSAFYALLGMGADWIRLQTSGGELRVRNAADTAYLDFRSAMLRGDRVRAPQVDGDIFEEYTPGAGIEFRHRMNALADIIVSNTHLLRNLGGVLAVRNVADTAYGDIAGNAARLQYALLAGAVRLQPYGNALVILNPEATDWAPLYAGEIWSKTKIRVDQIEEYTPGAGVSVQMNVTGLPGLLADMQRVGVATEGQLLSPSMPILNFQGNAVTATLDQPAYRVNVAVETQFKVFVSLGENPNGETFGP